jgi:hypothetical protein
MIVFILERKMYYATKEDFQNKKFHRFIRLENFESLEDAAIYLENKLQTKVEIKF